MAMINPALQVLEALDIWEDRDGHPVFTAATVVGAKVLSNMSYIQFGIQNQFMVHLKLTPATNEHNQTLQYSIVSNAITTINFSMTALHQHVMQLLGRAAEQGFKTAQFEYIQTPAKMILCSHESAMTYCTTASMGAYAL